MKVTILTLFPEVFPPILNTSILKKAQEKKLVTFDCINIRDAAMDKRKTVDDKPYGGGIGMVMRVDILYEAIQRSKIKDQRSKIRECVVLLDPKGKRFDQKKAKELSIYDHLILVCGHYEGIDARIEEYVDEIISIGDYVLTGGEIPAMVIVDSVVRLLPGVLPKGATESESFEEELLEYPQYTRPEVFRGKKVPEVLLSGNHKEIERWRKGKQKRFNGRGLLE